MVSWHSSYIICIYITFDVNYVQSKAPGNPLDISFTFILFENSMQQRLLWHDAMWHSRQNNNTEVTKLLERGGCDLRLKYIPAFASHNWKRISKSPGQRFVLCSCLPFQFTTQFTMHALPDLFKQESRAVSREPRVVNVTVFQSTYSQCLE